MAGLNFDSPYEFDSRTNGSRGRSDLLEMLQRAMEEQSSQQRPGYMPQPSASPIDSFGAPSGGLVGRLLALQAVQQQPRSFGGGRAQMSSAPADPNFRQLVRVSPAVQPQDGIGVSHRASYFPSEDGTPPDVLPISDQGPGQSGAAPERPAPVMAGFLPRIGGTRYPVPPMSPGKVPEIPMPRLPGAWQTGHLWLKLYAEILRSLATSGGNAPSWDGATILNQKKLPPRGQKIDDDEDEPNPDVWMENFRKGVAARARERGKTFSGKDPGDYCSNRAKGEKKRCGERYPDYAHKNFLQGCEARVTERWRKCVANGGEPDPAENAEWAQDPDEELYRNLER